MTYIMCKVWACVFFVSGLFLNGCSTCRKLTGSAYDSCVAQAAAENDAALRALGEGMYRANQIQQAQPKPVNIHTRCRTDAWGNTTCDSTGY